MKTTESQSQTRISADGVKRLRVLSEYMDCRKVDVLDQILIEALRARKLPDPAEHDRKT